MTPADMKPTVYIETSIVGYLASRPSRDGIVAANQQLTRDWWNNYRPQFDLFISEAVEAECAAGDATAALERKAYLSGIPILRISAEAKQLAVQFMQQIPLPSKADVDALHIAVATLGGLDFLLTWNCTHIANAVLQTRIRTICRKAGVEPPVICTPLQLKEI